MLNTSPNILTYTADYYPFGMQMPDRNDIASGGEYRYGFNGQEKEEDITGSASHTSAEYWMYDSRLGRRWEIDPLFHEYPGQSAYACFNNNAVYFIDPNGLEGEAPPSSKIEGENLNYFKNSNIDEAQSPSNISSRISPAISNAVSITSNIAAVSSMVKYTNTMLTGRENWLGKNGSTYLQRNNIIFKDNNRVSNNYGIQLSKNTAKKSVGKLTMLSNFGTGLSIAFSAYDYTYNPEYGKNIGGANVELGLDLGSSLSSYIGGPIGLFASYVYGFRVKPMLKAETAIEKRAVAGTYRDAALSGKGSGYYGKNYDPYDWMKNVKPYEFRMFPKHYSNPNTRLGRGMLGSDSTLKKNIQPIENILSKVLLLQIYEYGWKDSTKNNFGNHEYGVLAQELAEIFPDLVKKDKDGHLLVAYFELIPILIGALKEQQEIINQLMIRLNNLENKSKFKK